MCICVWKSEKTWNFSSCFSFCRGLWVPLPSQSQRRAWKCGRVNIPAHTFTTPDFKSFKLLLPIIQECEFMLSKHTWCLLFNLRVPVFLLFALRLFPLPLLGYIQLASFAAMCCILDRPKIQPGLHPSRDIQGWCNSVSSVERLSSPRLHSRFVLGGPSKQQYQQCLRGSSPRPFSVHGGNNSSSNTKIRRRRRRRRRRTTATARGDRAQHSCWCWGAGAGGSCWWWRLCCCCCCAWGCF